MKVNIVLITGGVLAMLFLASCSAETQPDPQPGIFIVGEQKPIIFVVEEGPKMFEVAHDDPNAWVRESREKRARLTEIRSLKEFKDEELVYEIEHRYRNVVRVIDGELVVGYDEDIDNVFRRDIEG